jgi:signal transduction histidine kinase
MQTKLLNRTRLQLTVCYSLVMGLLLSVFGFITYQVLIQAYLYAIDQELQTVAKAFHRNLEHVLIKPGQVSPALKEILSDLCLVDQPCSTVVSDRSVDPSHQKMLEAYQQNYYLRFLSQSEQLIATSGFRPRDLPPTPTTVEWSTLRDRWGERYHQISMPLHTFNQHTWGYLQVGRSLREVDRRLAGFQHVLWVGVPVSVLFVGLSSWWLAGLAMRPVQRSYRQMQQFTADAAHELRTPLTAILATTDSVLRMPAASAPDLRETVVTVDRQASRFLSMVKDLLLLSRLEQHTLSFQPRSLCLNDLVVDVVDEFAALAESADLTLVQTSQTPKPLEILGDEDQLYRLLSNLVANAITYTPPQGQVTLHLHQERHHAVIQVQDTGIGMTPQDRSRVFDRFYRVNQDRSRQSGGTGLGLAIAHAITEAHRGSLHVESTVGRGSTFTVRLPLKPRRPLGASYG